MTTEILRLAFGSASLRTRVLVPDQVPATGSDDTPGGTRGTAGRDNGSRRSTGSEIQLIDIAKLNQPTPISKPARTSVGQ
jgi:hypothetical protein